MEGRATPKLTRVSAIAIYTPDIEAARRLYLELGLRTADDSADQLVMNFRGGDTQLILHSDRDRQFVELVVAVDDVPELYSQLARSPDYTWIRTPHRSAGEWRAVVRLPDDNVFTLRSVDEAAHPSRTDRPSLAGTEAAF
jgi:catechol 2,3-dioxygenase-like lactoylglutathione lyase family enzyme